MDSEAMPLARTASYALIQLLQQQAASLLLYQSVLEEEAGRTFLELLEALGQSNQDGLRCLQAYGRWFKALAARNQSWQDYLIGQILRVENPFTAQAQQAERVMPASLVTAAQSDLRALQQLYQCRSAQLSEWVQAAANLPVAPVVWSEGPVNEPRSPGWNWQAQAQLRAKLSTLEDWADGLTELAAYYQQFGTGLFAEYPALGWQAGELVGIPYPDPVELTELVGYEAQQAVLLKNTEFLLAGYPALDVLLYGSRGSGKSSLVKALLPQYRDLGLRLVEVAKSDLRDLRAIAEQLRGLPQKFIIFVDDLSFEEDEAAYKDLKALLEGSLTARPQNIVVYATSNRRHLIREFFGDRPRPSEEVHAWDTVQEKLSFSDRFGLSLTFDPADQNTYLQMIRHLAVQAEIALAPADLEHRALQWATRRNGRSGRTARQFIDFLQAELASEQSFVEPADE